MTEPDTPAIDGSGTGIPAQIGTAIRGALTGPRALGALIGLVLIVLAGIVAPDDVPDWWAWVRVLLVWLLASIALTGIAGATLDDRMPRTSPLIIWGSLLLVVVVSLTFTALSTALAILILLLLLLIVRPGARQPAIFWLLVTVLTPLWVWSAFETWDGWLLMLVPIGAVGILAIEHAARAGASGYRARQLASWIVAVGLAAALLLVALLAGIAPGWVAAGSLAVVILAGIDLFALPGSVRNRIPAVALPLLALASLTLGWLVAL